MDKISRRLFLKWQMHGLLYLSAGASLTGLSKPVLADAIPDVAISKGAPAAATRASVEMLGGMARFVKKGQKVVIKPNMSFDQGPESATNTHPEVVRELVVMCHEAGAAQIRVLDHPLRDAEQCLRRSGIRDACNSVIPGICHNITDAAFFAEAKITGAQEMQNNAFFRDVLEADVLIAAPVAKSHGSAGVSLSLKGQMGLILDRRIMHSRYDLNTSIVDLFTRTRPSLAIIDATRVLTTNGPGGPGKVITPGEVIASADAVAADATAVASYEWYGRKMQPRQVGHIRIAHERGLGRMDIDKLTIKRVTL